jgi:quercetin dioxygenase-like cupin family protein
MSKMKKSGKPRPKELKLTDLIGYQEGSVVSRTLIDREAGTVTLFAFDEGQGLSEHTVPYEALVHIIEGEVEITISGRSHQLKAGEMMFLPANERHSVKARSKFKMLLTMIKS